MKKWLEPIGAAWSGIVTHKLRSFLTMLGIVIGVAAVIALMSVGRGTTASILESIESMGSDMITISPGATMSAGGFRGMMGSATTLTQEDAEAILEDVDNISTMAAYSTSSLQLIYGEENMSAQIIGTTTGYATADFDQWSQLMRLVLVLLMFVLYRRRHLALYVTLLVLAVVVLLEKIVYTDTLLSADL